LIDGKEIAKSKAEERQNKLNRIRRQRRNKLLVIIVIILAVVLGAYKLYNSGLFSVNKIEVSGNKFVTTAKIIDACKINQNSNILSISTRRLKDRIMKNPWIKDVTIRRALFHTLKIEVVERVPIVIISSNGKFYLVDDESFVIAERQYADDLNIPSMTELPVSEIKVGERIMNKSLENAIKCLKLMSPSLRKSITLLSAASVDKLSLYNKDNIEILYGAAEQAEEKNKLLEAILKKEGRQVIFIDVRNYPKSNPVLRRIDSVP